MAIRRAALHISSVAILIRRAALHISSVAMLIRRAALHISSVAMLIRRAALHTSSVAMLFRRAALHISSVKRVRLKTDDCHHWSSSAVIGSHWQSSVFRRTGVKMAYLQSIRRTSTCSKSNISQRRRNR